MKIQIGLGRPRDVTDGCRRYMPVAMRFDTRAWILTTEIEEDWDEDSKELWRVNKARLKESIMHTYGVEAHEQKVVDFAAMGPAAWSVIAPHNDVVNDIRRAFSTGSYYSALLGTVGLGERVLNDLVINLRDFYPEGEAAKRVRKKKSFDDWDKMAKALQDWGILDERVVRSCAKFANIRNNAVHYRSDRTLDARSEALQAMAYLNELITHVFAPHGGSPRFIVSTPGQSFLSLAAESEPLIAKYFLPSCALVSPDFEYRNEMRELWDEADYSTEELSDEQFAAHYNNLRNPPAEET